MQNDSSQDPSSTQQVVPPAPVTASVPVVPQETGATVDMQQPVVSSAAPVVETPAPVAPPVVEEPVAPVASVVPPAATTQS